MLTYQECLDLSELTADEIDAIASHEHIPEIVAAELGNYLVNSADGLPHIKRIILDDIAEAERKHQPEQVLRLKAVLQHFISTHPEHPSNQEL